MPDFNEPTKAVSNELACRGCGAMLKFKPGTLHITCAYCGAKEEIASAENAGKVEEQSLLDFLQHNLDAEEKLTATTVKCEGCGATSTMDASISSDKCPYCGSALVVKSGSVSTLHKPRYVLPFSIDHAQARQNFVRWIGSRWFIPGELKRHSVSTEKLNGMYLPFWTFDCITDSAYTGERGEYYYVTENYTATENGKSVQRTRRVRHTRWYSAHGSVVNNFDDLLIEATSSLDKEKLRKLEPWDLENLMPYDDKYLSGFRTETHTIDVKTGFGEAKKLMEPVIHNTILQDIGGDEQRVDRVATTYNDPAFKHILLPVWISAFRYKSKVYQFLVNARTGEVQGKRPYSVGKILLTVFAVIAVLLFLIVISNNKH
jgi:LSD1 subclass zinc finger protein